MPRNLPVGNGNMLIAFDHNYHMRELYYPYVGEENHTNGHASRMGVWCDGDFHWIDNTWEMAMEYLEDTLVTNVTLRKEGFPIEFVINDCVDFHETIYLKKVNVINKCVKDHDIRIFFSQDYSINENEIGDTAMYRPDKKVVVHYKRDRYFLINTAFNNEHGVDDYAIGSKGKNGLEGTYMDAVDGVLEKNPIEQGSVDSVVAKHLNIKSGETASFYYYIAVGKSWEEVERYDNIIIEKGPEKLFNRTDNYWKFWCTKEDLPLDKLPERLSWLYKKSLLILRTQIDNRGGILAANDSDVRQYNRDTYSYVWPRDGALVAHALDLAGYITLSSRFYDFSFRVIGNEGYMAHKYTPSENIGSSWHPWIVNGKEQLPIQEDETALIVWALWEHFEKFRDIEFIRPMYKKVVKNAANFMCDFIDEGTGLPKESYDLWEERLGVHTFTVASTYGGLMGAYKFAKLFGELELAKKYHDTAESIKAACIKHMYLEDEGYFVRMVNIDGGKVVHVDKNIDASMHSIFAFGMFEATDPRVKSSMENVIDKLWVKTEIGGVARYIGDPYYRISEEVPGNPWFITTLWLAFYYTEIGEKDKALDILHWVADKALDSGVLAEQVNPFTNEPLSVAPLTWSHATFVEAIQRFIDKFLK